jgi:hypothetical protein
MAKIEEFEELEFIIPAYKPDTMPLDRLLDYLTQIVALVGAPQDMHLVRIDESSTKPVLRMPVPAAIRARELTQNVRVGRGTIKQRDAYGTIRKMVRLDGGRPATLKDRTGVLIDFEPEIIVPVLTLRQATTFDGSLLRVGGAGDFTPILMQSLHGEMASGFMAPKMLAKEMGKFLFDPWRLAGIGNWERSPEGDWMLSKMLIQSFEPMTDCSLADAIGDLQKARVSWPANADDVLKAERLDAS